MSDHLPLGLKAGDWCYAGGQRALYLGPGANGQARVSINGSERLVNPEDMSLSGPDGRNPADLGGSPGSDPFQQLVDAAQRVRAGLQRDKNSAESRAATRRAQMRLLDRALDILTQTPKAPKTGKKHQWTDEQRQAAAERMRARNAEKAAKAEATA